jgi:hypothetical protein
VTGIGSHLTYSAVGEPHMRFVVGTFWASLRDNPGVRVDERNVYERALARVLRDPGASTCVVCPVGAPDEMIGWAVALPTALIFAYTHYRFRRGRFLGHHFGRDMVGRVSSSKSDDVLPLAIWTRAASRMAGKGFPIRYDLDEHEKFINLAR